MICNKKIKRVLFVTEYLGYPFDEGIKKTAHYLHEYLSKNYEVLTLCREGFDHPQLSAIKSNKLFLSLNVYRRIRQFNPDTLIYLPFSSSRNASYVRHWLLTIMSHHVTNLFISMQPKHIKSIYSVFLKVFKPQHLCTPSLVLHNYWNQHGVSNKLIPLVTDLDKFRPIALQQKSMLRKKYCIPEDRIVLSHMGHLNYGRNLEALIPLQDAGYQVVVAASSSTPRDSIGPVSLKETLIKKGIIILDGYIERIEEIYQLSDVYVFPVVRRAGSIGLPLSILEARACGIPVMTTEFESVRFFLGNDNNTIIYAEPQDFLEHMASVDLRISTSDAVRRLNNMLTDYINGIVTCNDRTVSR